jgi:RHS repeat-associated protein
MEGYQYFDGLGRSTRSFTYDGTTITPWIVTDAYYDGQSRVVSTSNPYRVASVSGSVPTCVTCTVTGYDILGRVHTVTLADGSIATTDYSNNTTTTTDPATKKRSATNDGLGRLVSVVENPGASPSYTTTYTYDLLNNLRKVTQDSQSRFFYYDALSRLRREKNPEQGINNNLTSFTDPVTQNAQWSVEYQYNDNVHLTKKIDPRNISITFGYDALNRPITRSYSDSTPPVDYIYDGERVSGGIANSKGRLTRVLTSSPFVSSYTYDAFDDMGRVLNTTQTVESNPSYGMSYQYNLAGGLTSETYPSTKVYATSYDIAGRIAGVTGPNSKVYAESFTYSPHGGVAQMKLGNGLWEDANFNNRLQPTEIGIGSGQTGTASVDRLKLSLDYSATDNNGNVKSQIITVPTIGSVTGTTLTQCYTYDEFNRLKTAEEKSGAACTGAVIWTQKFTYDQQGNRRFDTGTTVPVSFPNPTINTSNNNRIDGGQGYLYDLAGNVIQDPSHAYSFDAEERQATADNGATGTYSYDGKGQRVKSITSTGTTLYVYDVMGRLIAEYTSGNATGSGTSYITADMLGSPRVITTQDKSVKTRHDYLPFGEEIPAGYGSRTAQQGYAVDNVRQKFTGKERDTESGLDYFGARYYAGALGRFNSADSLFGSIGNPQTLNRYAYVLNNPLAMVDPTGHAEISVSQYDGTDDKLKQLKNQAIAEQRAKKYHESLTGYTEEVYERDFIRGAATSTVSQQTTTGEAEGVEIYYWGVDLPNRRVGHIAMKLSDGTYISLFPDGKHTPEQDITAEGREADRSYRLYGLNEKAIAAWWKRANTTYSKYSNNCADIVGNALRVGGLDALARAGCEKGAFCTPGNIETAMMDEAKRSMATGLTHLIRPPEPGTSARINAVRIH